MITRIPAEWEPHACCWMAWAVHREWGNVVSKVKRELSEVVQTIARYESVCVLAPRGPTLREARREFANCRNATVIGAPVGDIWMCDIAPIFARRRGEVIAIDFNFNGWGTRAKAYAIWIPPCGDGGKAFCVRRLSAPFIAEVEH